MLKKIASNTISQVISKAITALVSIFLIGMLTKYLSPEMYGQYNKVYNYLSIFTFLADLGLYTISIREISKDPKKQGEIIGNVMSLRLILGIGIIFLSLIIGYFLPGYNSLLSMLSIFIVAIFSVVSLMNSSVLSLMQANMKMEFSLFSIVFGKIVNLFFVFLIILLFPKQGQQDFFIPFLLIIFTGLLGILVNYLMNFYYANKIVKIKFLFDLEYMKYLFKTSLPYGFALFLSVVYFKVDIVLLSLIEGKNADISIALYSLPMKIVEVLMVLGMFFLNSLLPSLSLFFAENSKEKITKLLKFAYRFLFGFSIFLVVLGILFRENIIKLIATSDYLDKNLHLYTSGDAFIVVFFVLLFYFISNIFNYVFIASKNEKILLKINIFITLFNIIGNIILIPHLSFIGSGIITLLSQILLFGLGSYFSRKIIDFKFDFIYTFFGLLSGILLYLLGEFLIKNYSFGNILDIIIYGSLIGFLIICSFLGLNIKFIKEYKK